MAQVEEGLGGVPATRSPWRAVGDYVAITKPRIIELLLVTAIPTMILAARGWPDLRVAAAVIDPTPLAIRLPPDGGEEAGALTGLPHPRAGVHRQRSVTTGEAFARPPEDGHRRVLRILQ